MNFQITGRFPISTISRNSLNVSFWLGFNLTSSTRLITIHSSPLIGLVSGHSTETALLTLLNKARLSADRGESTLLVSLDLSAAFDTIDHSI